MDTSTFDARIAECKAEVVSRREELSRLAEAFRHQAVQALQGWTTKEVERAIAEEPESVFALDPKGLQKLKAELATLGARYPDLVESTFGGDNKEDLLCRILPTSTDTLELQGSAVVRALRSALVDLLSHCGALLQARGLVKGTPGGVWVLNTASGRPSFTGTPAWPSDLEETIRSYDAATRKLRVAQGELQKAEKEKTTAEALDLWNRS